MNFLVLKIIMSEQIKMALNIKDLCRLCAKKYDFSKDLLDKKNKNVLKMILEYIEISISDQDDLPSKVCLNCEEKVMSFQLFVVECLKVQENLRRMTLDNACNDTLVKLEDEINSFGLNLPMIKSEVKVELQNDDLANALHNNELLAGIEVDDFNNGEDSYDSDGDMSDVALATLKEAKLENVVKKSKVLTEEEKIELKNVLRKPNLSIRDFVKLKCDTCEESIKTWSALWYHYGRVHKTRPYIYCICGFVIRSKSALYKHVSDHKVESRKLRKSESGSDKQYDEKYSSFNVTDFVNFTCVICERQCKSWYTLQSHCERFHKVKPEVRCICGVALKSKSVLYKHVQDHKNPNNICCDKCPRITKSVAVMNKHKLRHVPKSERKFACGSCDKVFNTKELLKSHVKSHIPIEERKIYRCDICFLKFTTRSSCASHKRIVHDKIKSYVCDLCGYACGTGGELRQHRAIHSEDKPFVCIKCYKSFKTYSNLKTHMDTHEDTSYACHVCNRVLNSRRTLRKHLLVHEDKCQHVCSYCNKAFKRRQTLKVHMHTHTGDKPLSCKWCDERFSYASTLRSHRLRCHPDKMAARYPSYQHTAQEGYLKNDAVPGVMKGDLEAIQ